MVSFPPVNGRARLRAFFVAPLRRQTYRNLLYLGLAVPLGIAYFIVVVTGVTLGISLAIFLVGIPILASLVIIGIGLADVERWLATRLLDREFETRAMPTGESTKERVVAAVTDSRTWAPLVYLPAKFVFGLFAFLIPVTLLSMGISLLFVPLYFGDPGVSIGVFTGSEAGPAASTETWLFVGVVSDQPIELHPALEVGWNKLLVGFETVLTLDDWQVRTLPDALAMSVVGAFVCLTTLNVVNWLARLAGWFAQLLLDGGYSLRTPNADAS